MGWADATLDDVELGIPSVRLWSSRIPAAIAKGEGLLHPTCFYPECKGKSSVSKQNTIITAGEVALAKALWAHSELECVYDAPVEYNPALRAFCEKVEEL